MKIFIFKTIKGIFLKFQLRIVYWLLLDWHHGTVGLTGEYWVNQSLLQSCHFS